MVRLLLWLWNYSSLSSSRHPSLSNRLWLSLSVAQISIEYLYLVLKQVFKLGSSRTRLPLHWFLIYVGLLVEAGWQNRYIDAAIQSVSKLYFHLIASLSVQLFHFHTSTRDIMLIIPQFPPSTRAQQRQLQFKIRFDLGIVSQRYATNRRPSFHESSKTAHSTAKAAQRMDVVWLGHTVQLTGRHNNTASGAGTGSRYKCISKAALQWKRE